jgi:hypothetical protein
MYLALEESEKLITIELQEYVVQLLLTDLKNFKKVMLELSADYLKLRKLEMIILPF